MSLANTFTTYIPLDNGSFTFVKDSSNNVNLLKYETSGYGSYKGSRITPVIPDSNELKQYTGTYYSEELATEYLVDTANDGLIVKFRRLGDLVYTPDMSAKDKFLGQLGVITFFKDDLGRIKGFKLSQGRTKNIVFNKRE